MEFNLKAYIVQNKINYIRKNSAAGGFYSVIAKYVIERNGVAFGAILNNDFEVIHYYADSLDEMINFSGSKYTQSRIGDIYKKIKILLDDDRYVAFGGTPCQIEGLCNFLGKTYMKLFLVDLVCKGVASPKYWGKYISYQEKKNNSAIKKVVNRGKKYGYESPSITIEFENNKIYNRIPQNDLFLKAYNENLILRPSCYNCKFKTANHSSDFTIFDCWNAKLLSHDFDCNGTTNVIVRSQKGNKLLNDIKNEIKLKEVCIEKIIKLDGVRMFSSAKKNMNRDLLFKDIDDKPIYSLVNQYCKITIKDRIKSIIIPILYYTKLLRLIKFVYRKINKREVE